MADQIEEPMEAPKIKKPRSEAQMAAFAKAQEARIFKAQEKKESAKADKVIAKIDKLKTQLSVPEPVQVPVPVSVSVAAKPKPVPVTRPKPVPLEEEEYIEEERPIEKVKPQVTRPSVCFC